MKQETKGAIDMYLEQRVPTGGFLRAVLENNLMEAFIRADEENSRDMKEIVSYLYWNAPRAAWGSEEAVSKWLTDRL